MPMFARGEPEGFLVVDRWEHGVGWIVHPEETMRRNSHAAVDPRSDDIWLFDPIYAPGVDDLILEQSVGQVEGVAVLSNAHVRDAAKFAEQYEVPVTVPEGLDRAAEAVDAPVERASDSVAGFELRQLSPLLGQRETIAYRPADRTLYVPDFLTTCKLCLVGDERLGMNTLSRLRPPRKRFLDLDPERVILGHGEGVFERAPQVLADALENARRRFPLALRSQLGTDLKAYRGEG